MLILNLVNCHMIICSVKDELQAFGSHDSLCVTVTIVKSLLFVFQCACNNIPVAGNVLWYRVPLVLQAVCEAALYEADSHPSVDCQLIAGAAFCATAGGCRV